MITNFLLKVNTTFAMSNPFFQAYALSDWLGKGIFLLLYLLSLISWALLLYKVKQIADARKKARAFRKEFFESEGPLFKNLYTDHEGSPFHPLYSSARKHTISLLNKNQQHIKNSSHCYLSAADLNFVQAHLAATGAEEVERLDKNLFILSTVVSLAPFLGLLGTVWGILITFSSLQHASAAAMSNQMFLGGLSLALATTVLGLLDAIPALIGYNYLKNQVRGFETELDSFSTELLATVEMYYRKVDVQ
jgi:biopolymer transport protein TolQ